MSASENDWYDWVGNRVCVKGTLLGTLKFVGETHLSDGFLCGVALDDSFGKYDGMVDGKRYFTCRPNCGIFVPLSKVTRVKETLNKNLLSERNLNETFEVLKLHDNMINKLETHPVNFASEIKEVERNFKLRSDSEESLGILPPDVIDLDVSSELVDFDIYKIESLNNENMQVSQKPEAIFEFLPIRNLSESIPETVIPPKYASTPRHTASKKFEFDLNEESTFICEPQDLDAAFHNSSEVVFEIEKFKNNPNLTSTSKIFDSCRILDVKNKDRVQPKDINIYHELNKTLMFTNQLEGNNAETLNITFDLKATDITKCLNEPDEVLNVDDGKLYFSKNKKNIDRTENINEIIPSDNLCQPNDSLNNKFTFPVINANLNKLQANHCETSTLDANENLTTYSNNSDSPCDIENSMLENTFIVQSPVQEISDCEKSTVPLHVNKNNKSNLSKRKTISFFGTKNKTVKFTDNVSKQRELNSTFHKTDTNMLPDANVASQFKNRKSMHTIPSISKVKNPDGEFKKPFPLNIRSSSRIMFKTKTIKSNSEEITNSPLQPNLGNRKSNSFKITSTKLNKENKSEIKLSSKLKSKFPINIPNIQSSIKPLKIDKLYKTIGDCLIPSKTNENNQTEMPFKSLPSNQMESLIKVTKLPVSSNIKQVYQSDFKSSEKSSVNELPQLPSDTPASEVVTTKRLLIKEIQKPSLQTKEKSVPHKLPRRNSLLVPSKTKLPVDAITKRLSVLPTISAETDKNVEPINMKSSSKNSKPSDQPLSQTTSAATSDSYALPFDKKNDNLRKSISRKRIIEPRFGFRQSICRKNV